MFSIGQIYGYSKLPNLTILGLFIGEFYIVIKENSIIIKKKNVSKKQGIWSTLTLPPHKFNDYPAFLNLVFCNDLKYETNISHFPSKLFLSLAFTRIVHLHKYFSYLQKIICHNQARCPLFARVRQRTNLCIFLKRLLHRAGG